MVKNIEEIKKKVVPILKKNKVVRAGIFGSYAKGEQNKNSDVDILIEFNDPKMSLLGIIALELELKKLLGKKVDLLTYNGISPYLKDIILNEEVRII